MNTSNDSTSKTTTDGITTGDEIIVYTDGGCSGNPGAGGWGIVIIADGIAKQLSGGEAMTTNNKMELSAAIAALSVIKNTPSFAGRHVTVNIDSQYVKNGITVWIHSWKKKGWVTADKKPVKNKELWLNLDNLVQIHKVKFVKVKGHSDNEFNNKCDELAVAAYQKYLK